MKRSLPTLLSLLFTLSASPLYALRPGDPAEELAVKWIRGVPLAVLPPAKEELKTDELKAVVFLLTRSANAPETLTLLNRLWRTYAGSVRFALVTPDREADAAQLLAAFPDFSLPFGIDEKRKLTAQYMNGSLLYPMAFVIDPDGKILWNGEAVDLGEMLEAWRTKQFDAALQRRISPQLDELQTLLRANNDRRMKQVTAAILKSDPGNAAALRLRTFALENSGRSGEAWQLILSQIEKRPRLVRLYFSALDLAGRHPELGSRAAEIAERYSKAVNGDPDADNLMSYLLLNRRPEDPAALRAAQQLLRRAVASLPREASPALRASVTTTRALLEWRLGRPETAWKLQQEATKFWHDAENPAAEKSSRERETLYRTVVELRQTTP